MKQKYLIILCSVLYLNAFSQIVNEGTLQVKSSTTVYIGDEYTNKTTGIHNNDGNLYVNNNFINNGSTSANSGTTFFNSSVNDIQTISGSSVDVNFFNLSINNSLSGVKVADEFCLIASNSVNLLDGDLRLEGEAQLLQTNTGVDLNSAVSGKLLRDQQGNFSVYGFNYWSSPVNNGGTFSLSGGLFDGTDANINPFTPQQVLFNSHSPYDGEPSVIDGGGNVLTPLTINTTWLYKYIKIGGNVSQWIAINENGVINPGEGYTMKGTNTVEATQNYVFKGVPNNGTYTFPVIKGEHSLIGNPYPSAIDSEEFIKDNLSVSAGGYAATNVINGALYFWVEGGSTSHSYSGYYGGYATRNLTEGAPPSVSPILIANLGTSEFAEPPKQYMAVAQGFLILAEEDGDVVFKNSQRVFKTENSGESVHYKNTNLKNNPDKSIVRIGYDDPEGFHRQIVLGFLPNSPADLGYNIAYDALMHSSREDDLYFTIDNDFTNKYVIQGVGAFDESYEFPLGLNITEDGKHIIMLDAVENFSNAVYIKDNILNTTYNLSESNFEPNLPAGEYLDRFKLVFKAQNTLDVDEFGVNAIKVYYNDNNSIIINNLNSLKINKVAIFNILGQKIYQVKNDSLEQREITIPFRKKDGIYLVNIESDQGKETYKILKK